MLLIAIQFQFSFASHSHRERHCRVSFSIFRVFMYLHQSLCICFLLCTFCTLTILKKQVDDTHCASSTNRLDICLGGLSAERLHKSLQVFIGREGISIHLRKFIRRTVCCYTHRLAHIPQCKFNFRIIFIAAEQNTNRRILFRQFD